MQGEYTQKLKAFDLENRAALRAAGELLIPQLDAVLDDFYSRALADPQRSAFFADERAVKLARNAQKRHWELLISGDFKSDYFQSVERVGRTHARINLPLEIFFSAYACAGSNLLETLLDQPQSGKFKLRRASRHGMVGALSRALMLDTQLVVEGTFSVWGEEQNKAFSHLSSAIKQVSNGNLAHQIPSPTDSDYPVRYDVIREQFNGAIADIGRLIRQLDGSILDLLSRLDHVTDATEDLSSRTTSQSATLEETAAAMAQLTNSINESAEKTKETSRVGQKAQQDVQHGATVIGEASTAMSSIQKSSDSIANITAAIDDVAFQTNLLALNAGVEAARAGDAGRGFAVVASEVRSLALRSSDAAKDIKGLINTSGESVGQGAKLIGRAEEAFQDIVESFEQVAGLTEAVAVAFQEQSLGITEINTSIHEMDRTTQLNANMVEETLGAMQAMRDQASSIREQISGLRYAARGGYSGMTASHDQGDQGPLLLTA